MREFLVSELYRELLGPRNGPHEKINRNPLAEYIAGVLEPEKQTMDVSPENEMQILLQESSTTAQIPEDDDVFEEITSLHPDRLLLNPLSRPNSFGISFCIQGEDPKIKICVSWARYFFEDGGWKRNPRIGIIGEVPIADIRGIRRIYLDSSGTESAEFAAEICIYIYVKHRGNDIYYVRIHMRNFLRLPDYTGSKEDWEKKKTEYYIFQPQIRVNCVSGRITGIREKELSGAEMGEDREMELIYRKKPILARGYMCAAYWKEIDPEIPDCPVEMRFPPFHWVDGELDAGIAREFTCPDVRSEFLPVFAVGVPEYGWSPEFGEEPELRAEILAESWDPGDLYRKLAPLVDGYEKWINRMEDVIRSIYSGGDLDTALGIAIKCRTVLGRMRRSLEILRTDPDARLAFCFANRVMDLQSRWAGRREGLRWRPFQLGFILLVIESIYDRESNTRDICDILVVPTGAGKTEAYLAIAAFAIALRRRKSLRQGSAGTGVCVIMRYTLRLLTVQQFRRALRMILACEYLRVANLGSGGPVGWRPSGCDIGEDFIWGTARFSLGLWVGGGVTPNRLGDYGRADHGGRPIPGALSILQGNAGNREWGEPAQIMECPVCGSVLAIPDSGLPVDRDYHLHLIIRVGDAGPEKIEKRIINTIKTLQQQYPVIGHELRFHGNGFATLSLLIRPQSEILPEQIDEMWREIERNTGNVALRSARASRPGYFLLYCKTRRNTDRPYDFIISCPNPGCPLNREVLWAEGKLSGKNELEIRGRKIRAPDGLKFADVPDFMRIGENGSVASRIPIPAQTVDEQIYTEPPTFLVGTVDKIARLAFEPRYSTIFGLADKYSKTGGYFRTKLEPPSKRCGEQSEGVPEKHLAPPDLIIQDEIHLIEGPLGSMVGFYEGAIEYLISEHNPGLRIKYIASSATVRGAKEHIRSIFAREVSVFPPRGIDVDDRFFIRIPGTGRTRDTTLPTRLYMGICSPGLGPHTPLVRIWSRLLQSSYELAKKHGRGADPYWTVVGYFNAIRELAGLVSLWRQDIPERLGQISRDPRKISDDSLMELSSRCESTNLPVLLNRLEKEFSGNPPVPGTPDAVLATSMFGTGVDVPRLGLMIVHGQPKTTSAYIQATGRVGRKGGGLIVVFYRATRPRDMSHYENFCGYHMCMEKFIEHLTATPFSPGTVERCAGPVAVAILRISENEHQKGGAKMVLRPEIKPEIDRIVKFFERRGQQQPEMRRTPDNLIEGIFNSKIDRWSIFAHKYGNLIFAEYGMVTKPVVLGDPEHEYGKLPVVYRNVPQSLRDVEEMTKFETG